MMVSHSHDTAIMVEYKYPVYPVQYQLHSKNSQYIRIIRSSDGIVTYPAGDNKRGKQK